MTSLTTDNTDGGFWASIAHGTAPAAAAPFLPMIESVEPVDATVLGRAGAVSRRAGASVQPRGRAFSRCLDKKGTCGLTGVAACPDSNAGDFGP